MSAVPKRKLIEVALPLEAINRESAREKSIRHGHPSTLHLWWARRPLAAARAVLFAQLVDDPSSHPEEFPTEEAQKAERERLHRIIEGLVVWENVRDESLLGDARAEIMKSTQGQPPPILDPFAGGGTIPLEAQRLGLVAHASDLNPVAVLINKALVEIPPRFHDQAPVFPGMRESQTIAWEGSRGLAGDVHAYGQWMRDEAEARIGRLYPKASLPDGSEAPVIAWIWARTVTCPNPACGIAMPLVRSWWLGKKKGRESYVSYEVIADSQQPSGRRVRFRVGYGRQGGPTPEQDGTVGRSGAVCVACHAGVDLGYVRQEAKAGRMSATLMAIAAEGNRRRVYLPPNRIHKGAAAIEVPPNVPHGILSQHPQYMGAPRYGMTDVADLYTSRQLVALTTLSDLVEETRQRVTRDAMALGIPRGERLSDSGSGAEAYADAVATYLSMTVSRLADLANSLCRWEPNAECPRQLFARQAVSFTWDYAEGNPLGKSSGSWSVLLDGGVRSFGSVAFSLGDVASGDVVQANASTRDYKGFVVSTDPPYYDNVPYADLSDVFYAWQRRSLRGVYPNLFGTLLVPKSEELVANHVRQGGKAAAKKFFEDGFREVFTRILATAETDIPVTVYYAFKQTETTSEGDSSTGWETLLDGMVKSGWVITATWPLRTEAVGRLRNHGSNALASSIVLALRPRQDDAMSTDRRGFIAALRAELPRALRELQQGTIAPVDLPQAAIGPGMSVFSRYTAVIEADGSPMTVRSALARINEILDQVLNEQEGDFDATTRFAIAWYRQHGYGTGRFGDADNLARARNTSVETMDRDQILTSRAGKVTLLKPSDLPVGYDVLADTHTSAWEALHHLIRLLETEGVQSAGEFLITATSRPDGAVEADLVKELAFLLFRVSETSGRTQDALSFNTFATSWPDIVDVSRSVPTRGSTQSVFDFDEEA